MCIRDRGQTNRFLLRAQHMGHACALEIRQRHAPQRIRLKMPEVCLRSVKMLPLNVAPHRHAQQIRSFAPGQPGACLLYTSPLGRGSAFWAGSLLAAAVILLAALTALNFNAAFVFFHHLFFPGKDNWLFDPATDQIILILPELFFRNCAIAIAALLLIGCAILILWDLRQKR